MTWGQTEETQIQGPELLTLILPSLGFAIAPGSVFPSLQWGELDFVSCFQPKVGWSQQSGSWGSCKELSLFLEIYPDPLHFWVPEHSAISSLQTLNFK